jgi:glycosyltransferase involved in cell wall biosynthesis
MAQRRILLLSVGYGGKAEPGSYLTPALAARGYALDVMRYPDKVKAYVLARMLTERRRLGQYDAVVTDEYARAGAVAMRRQLTGLDRPLIAIGLNQSGQLYKLGRKPVDGYFDRLFQGIDASLVHSQHERLLWKEAHGMDPSKIAFSPWGADIREGAPGPFREGPYVCMVGRNNRDLDTFREACAFAEIKGVAIISDHVSTTAVSDEGVEIIRNAPMADCIACIRDSLANLILLKDDHRGAGHITAVIAMHKGRPSIYSRAQGLKDYLRDGETGIAVPFHDAAAAAAAIDRLRTDHVEAEKISAEAKAFAERWLTTKTAADLHADLIVRAIEGKPLPPVPEGWPGPVAAEEEA